MEFFIGFLVFFLLLLLIILLFPVRLYITYKKDEKETVSCADIRYMFLKFRVYPDERPKKSEEKPEKKKISFEEKKNKLEEYIRIFEGIREDAVKILDYAASKSMIIEKIGIDINFGFEDAMHTGIFTGLLNGFVYSVLGIIHHRATLKEMKVNLQPIFGNPCFKTQFDCIIRLRNVHIIIVAVDVLKLLRKMKKIKGGK